MARLYTENGRILFETPESARVLLDCKDLLSNKSRLPLHRLPDQTHLTVPDLLQRLIERQQRESDTLAFPFGVTDTLLAARLIRFARPVSVLEYGSCQGELSVHLAELLGAFHEASDLVCGNDAVEPAWLNRIAGVEHPPRFSFLSADFGAFPLESGRFDAVLINGLANFMEPRAVISDALRLVRNDGVLICCAWNAPLLESAFQLFFEKREEYELEPAVRVMLAKACDCSWKPETPDPGSPAREAAARAEELLAVGEAERQELSSLLKTLLEGAQTAAGQGDTEEKIRLLAQREGIADLYARLYCS